MPRKKQKGVTLKNMIKIADNYREMSTVVSFRPRFSFRWERTLIHAYDRGSTFRPQIFPDWQGSWTEQTTTAIFIAIFRTTAFVLYVYHGLVNMVAISVVSWAGFGRGVIEVFNHYIVAIPNASEKILGAPLWVIRSIVGCDPLTLSKY